MTATFCNKIDAIAITVVFYNESVAFCNRVSWWIKYEIIATIGYQKERERERERERESIISPSMICSLHSVLELDTLKF